MSEVNSLIVVGASAAGVSCVRQLRKGGFEGTITLIDKDKNGAYERPPLSKKVLMDVKTTVADIALINSEELAQLHIDSLFGEAVASVSPESRQVTLASGKTLTADAIVLATGGEARRLPIEGADLPQVMVLRHFQDAELLRQKLTANVRIAVIGGGFIGAETVASLASLDAKVHWLDAASLPLSHLLPEPLCEKIIDHHCAQGVELVTDCRIEKFIAQADGSVVIAFQDGTELPVDVVVLGVGMFPETTYFSKQASAQLVDQTRGGILVDENQQTEFPGVYACGDVAAVKQSDGSSVRHEHWQSAQHQGECAACAILHLPLPAPPVDWFWSDQGDLHIEMAGKMSSTKEHIAMRQEGDWPIYFSVVNNRVTGAVSINNPNAVRIAIRMIRNDVAVELAQLADPDLPLRQLMRN